MDGEVHGWWHTNIPCNNERTIALWTDASRRYKGTSSELMPPGPRSPVGVLPVQPSRSVGWGDSVIYPLKRTNDRLFVSYLSLGFIGVTFNRDFHVPICAISFQVVT